MRNNFPEYYRVTRESLIDRFKDLTFIFDANALLDIFRLPNTTTCEVFEVLVHYSEQIEIPYHAAEEYNRRIHSVLQEQLRNIDTAQSAFNGFVKLLEAKRNQPYISLGSARKLKALKNSILCDFQSQREYLLNQLLHGEFQNKMSDILNGRVLPPFTKEEIKLIEDEGIKRYENKIPPGWKDKGENAYGDLINWKEILRYAKENQKSIILVTNDQKVDWICKYEGKTICPHYELLREFYQTVENNKLVFHIYTLDSFLDFVHNHDKDSVSEGAISQVREVLNEYSVYDLVSSMERLKETFAKINESSNKYRDFSEILGSVATTSSVMLKDEMPTDACEKDAIDDNPKIADDSNNAAIIKFEETEEKTFEDKEKFSQTETDEII